jgi:hypothetical protein
LRFNLIHKESGITVCETYSDYGRLVIGLDGNVYEVSDWSYEFGGGADIEDVSDKYEIIVIE